MRKMLLSAALLVEFQSTESLGIFSYKLFTTFSIEIFRTLAYVFVFSCVSVKCTTFHLTYAILQQM